MTMGAPTQTTAGKGTSATSLEDSLSQFTPFSWSGIRNALLAPRLLVNRSLREIRDAIPPHLFIKHDLRAVLYLLRDLLLALSAWKCALYIDPYFRVTSDASITLQTWTTLAHWAAWCTYWWFQGLIFTGVWVIGHECGHGAFSNSKAVNDFVGFVVHTLLWTPYYSWKISHHRHHCHHASMERDEVYVPRTRSDLGIPRESEHHSIDYEEYFGDTPIYTLYTLVRQQLLAFPAYLLFNVSGQKGYPKWTNHFDPRSILFTKEQRNKVIASNVGISTMAWITYWASCRFGVGNVIKFYGIPWLAVTHWFILITYLHHTDPVLPHYRNKEWNYQRGAAATVDRPILGWQGRFFLHDVAHFHVIHHFFPKMPWYNGEEATKHLKAFLGEHYVYSEVSTLKALWHSYNHCQFVEDEGDILFYKDKEGRAVRKPVAKLVEKY